MKKGYILKIAIILFAIIFILVDDGLGEKWRRRSKKTWTKEELRRLREEALRSQPPLPDDKVITIRRGDTLWDLADLYLKNPWLWPRLWAYDGNLYILNPHKIYPKRKLVIPPETWVRRVKEVPPKVKVPPKVEIEEDRVLAERLREEIDTLKRIKEEKEKRIDELQKEITELRKRDIERERVKRELEGKLEDALTDHEIYVRTVVAKKELEIARLKREVEQLKEDIYALEKELAIKEAEIQEKERIICAQNVTINEQILQINRLTENLDKERKELEQFYAFIGIIGGIIALSLSN